MEVLCGKDNYDNKKKKGVFNSIETGGMID